MTPQETYNKHGFYQIKGFIPRFFTNYLKEILNTKRINDTDNIESYYLYGDPAFDTFSLLSAPLLSELIGTPLSPTHTEANVYINDDSLLPQIYKKECQHSVVIFLGGDYTHLWPIWMKKEGKNINPEMVVLEEGDCVIYKGSEIHHWRDHFEGTSYYQLYMHFVETEGEYKDEIYDTRPYLGMKSDTRREPQDTESK